MISGARSSIGSSRVSRFADTGGCYSALLRRRSRDQREIETIAVTVRRPVPLLEDVDAALADDLPRGAVTRHRGVFVHPDEGVALRHGIDDERRRTGHPRVHYVPVGGEEGPR